MDWKGCGQQHIGEVGLTYTSDPTLKTDSVYVHSTFDELNMYVLGFMVIKSSSKFVETVKNVILAYHHNCGISGYVQLSYLHFPDESVLIRLVRGAVRNMNLQICSTTAVIVQTLSRQHIGCVSNLEMKIVQYLLVKRNTDTVLVPGNNMDS